MSYEEELEKLGYDVDTEVLGHGSTSYRRMVYIDGEEHAVIKQSMGKEDILSIMNPIKDEVDSLEDAVELLE